MPSDFFVSVRRSVECDFLLLAASPPVYRAVIEQIGFASSFQETHGYYADAVGLATVVLPSGWQERLVPLTDEAGETRSGQTCFLPPFTLQRSVQRPWLHLTEEVLSEQTSETRRLRRSITSISA